MLNKRPVFPIAICFCLGVLTIYKEYNIILISAAVVLIVAFAFILKQSTLTVSTLCMASFIVSLVLTGIVLNNYNNITFSSTTEKYGVSATIIDQRQSLTYQLLTLSVHSVNDEKTNFKMYLYVYDFNQTYSYGDEIYAITKLEDPIKARFKGDFDNRLYAMSRNLRYIESTNSDSIMIDSQNTKWSLGKMFFTIRKHFWNSEQKLLPPEETALAQGITLGDKLSFTDQMKTDFQESGMAYLAALAGLHINIIMMALFFLFSTFSRKRILLNILMALGIIAFYFIVGYSPSVLRAVSMALIAIIGNLIWRRSEIFNTLAISALLILVLNPFALFDIGFQMSFLATLGIALFIKPFAGKNEILKKSLIMLFIPTIASLLTTSVVTAASFNQVNFTAIWSNVVIVPLFTVGLIGTYIMCILNAIFPFLAKIISYSMFVILFLINKIIAFSSSYGNMNLKVRVPSFVEVAFYSAFLYFIYMIEVKIVALWSKKHY